jgi:hypothetical protein
MYIPIQTPNLVRRRMSSTASLSKRFSTSDQFGETMLSSKTCKPLRARAAPVMLRSSCLALEAIASFRTLRPQQLLCWIKNFFKETNTLHV